MKDKLLYYQGGGYAGCVWEWNFCFWDIDGKWYNLFASGCSGLKTEAEALKLAETLKMQAELIDLTDVERFKQFQKDNNAQLVLQIAQELNENYNYSLELTCCVCDCSFIADSNKGDAAINNCDIICCECLVSGMCGCCGEFVGEDKIRYLNESDEFEAKIEALTGCCSICNDCYEYNKDEIKSEDLKELVFQAFLTGKPDIFDNSLRKYWIGD